MWCSDSESADGRTSHFPVGVLRAIPPGLDSSDPRKTPTLHCFQKDSNEEQMRGGTRCSLAKRGWQRSGG